MAEEEPETFDADYVKQLRNEAAKYRTQVRDLESRLEKVDHLEQQVNSARVENELIRRGVQADPSWVPINDEQDPSEAVDQFLEKWPHLSPSKQDADSKESDPEPETKETKQSKKPLPRNQSNTDSPGPKAKGAWTDRSVDEIKQDPQARENLSDLYKELVKQSSHQG